MLRTSKWIAAATLLIAASAVADDRFEKTSNATVSYEGGTVRIEHRYGKITVHTGNDREVVARAVVRSSDAEIGKNIVFHVENGPHGVDIRTSFPSVHYHGDGDLSYAADIDVAIPERAPLEINSRFGSIEVIGLGAPVKIVSRQGGIQARNIHGGTIENAFGAVTVESSAGDLVVQSGNGAVSVSDSRGNLAVTNRFAAVSVERIGGNLSISSSNAAVSAIDVKGPTTITNSFASVTAQNISGPTSIATSSGNVTASNIGGDLEVNTRFGLVKAENVRGNLNVENANGSVSASEIRGDAHVKTSYSPVFLKGIDGRVDVQNQNGVIGISGLRGGCNDVTLKTTYSPIKISLASNANYTVTAHTTYGSINTDFPFTVTSKSTSESSDSLSGTIGKGGCKMELTTSNAGITITRE